MWVLVASTCINRLILTKKFPPWSRVFLPPVKRETWAVRRVFRCVTCVFQTRGGVWLTCATVGTGEGLTVPFAPRNVRFKSLTAAPSYERAPRYGRPIPSCPPSQESGQYDPITWYGPQACFSVLFHLKRLLLISVMKWVSQKRMYKLMYVLMWWYVERVLKVYTRYHCRAAMNLWGALRSRSVRNLRVLFHRTQILEVNTGSSREPHSSHGDLCIILLDAQ